MANSRKRFGSAVVVPLIVGIIGFGNVARLPRFAAIHTVDVVQLLGSGMLFGIALASVIANLRGDGNRDAIRSRSK